MTREPAETGGDPDLAAITRHGFDVAYRMLGSVSDVEGVVQGAMLRLARAQEPLEGRRHGSPPS